MSSNRANSVIEVVKPPPKLKGASLANPNKKARRYQKLEFVDSDEEEEEDDDDVDLDMLPTMLVYRDGQLVHNWVRVDWEAGRAGFEELLNKYDLFFSFYLIVVDDLLKTPHTCKA